MSKTRNPSNTSEIASALTALQSSEESQRLYAVEDLALIKSPETAVPLARQLQQDDSQIVRDALVFTLRNMDATAAYDELFALFSSPEAFLRNAAVSIFSGDGEDAVAYLGARLDHADREVRKLILDALVGLGNPSAVMAIRAGLFDSALNVQITAAEYLGRLGDRESCDDLLAVYATASEPMLRASILEALLSLDDAAALGKLSVSHFSGEHAQAPDPVLLPLVLRLAAQSAQPPDLMTMLGSVEDLGAYAEDILDTMSTLARRNDPAVASEAFFGILERLAGLSQLREDLRFACLRLLMRTGRAGAREIVKGMATDSRDEDLKAFCRELLKPSETDAPALT